MKRVGEMLKEARIKRGIKLSDVELGTKIRLKFLESIERDDYSQIPSSAYAKGFVKNYSEFLGLDSSTMLAFYRRQTEDISKQSLLPQKPNETLRNSFLRLTPGRFIAVILGFLVFTFLLYFGLQYQRLQQAPTLSIEKPVDGKIVEEKKVEVIGATDPDATVTINGVGVLVRSDGKFFDQVALEVGVNTITVIATSRFGKSSTVIRKIGLKQ